MTLDKLSEKAREALQLMVSGYQLRVDPQGNCSLMTGYEFSPYPIAKWKVWVITNDLTNELLESGLLQKRHDPHNVCQIYYL